MDLSLKHRHRYNQPPRTRYSAFLGMHADANTMNVEGKQHTKIYHARIERNGKTEISTAERHFCSKCGTFLWVYHLR